MIENKHILTASKLLVNSIKTVSSKEMTQLGALDDIRRTLQSQKNVRHTQRHKQLFLIIVVRHSMIY